MSTRRRLLDRSAVSAAVGSCVPVVVEVLFTSACWGAIPERLPVTFGVDGRTTGSGTLTGTITVLACIQFLLLVAAISSAPARDRRKAQLACATTTGLVAILAISWIAIVGKAALGWSASIWWALIAGPVWGLVPYMLLRRTSRQA